MVQNQKVGKIVILVGGSSAGKTSLGKALQAELKELYVLMGIDMFWFTLPPKQLDLDQVDPDYYSWHMEERDGKPLFVIKPGPILDRLMIARYPAIRAYLDAGFNVIADEVLWKREWLEECIKALDGYDVTFVKVFCSDEEGARREIARGDRHVGWNRGSAYYSDLDCLYDAEIDTTSHSPAECAKLLATQLQTTEGSAFKKMRSQFFACI